MNNRSNYFSEILNSNYFNGILMYMYIGVIQVHVHIKVTGTCGQDPMLLPFFLTSTFFSYKQHFATFYVSLYDIYTINTIKQ